MSLPTIESYPLPETMPQPRHAWSLQHQRAALLVHDMQAYFLAPYGKNDTIALVIQHIAKLIAACRQLGIPVIYTAQQGNQHAMDRGLQWHFWGPGMKAVPVHESIAPELTPESQDIKLVKHRYSAFQRTNLEHILRVRKRDQLMIAGVYAHIGCVLTAAEAFQLDVEPFLIGDALADFSLAQHQQALNWAAQTCATPLLHSKALRMLEAPDAHAGVQNPLDERQNFAVQV